MASATTYNVVNNREDKLDFISLVAPEDTPMYSTLPKSKAPSAVTQEWTADDLDNPSFPGYVEGSDVSSYENKAANRALLSNTIQEFRRTFQVSRIQEKVATAGVSSEIAHAKSRAVVELKRDIESAIGADVESQVGDGSSAHKMRGMVKWLTATNTNINVNFRIPSASVGTTSSLTESTLNDVLQSVYETRGTFNNYRLFSGPTLKNKITMFTRAEGTTTATNYHVNEVASKKQVTLSVMRYISDWGTFDVINSLFLERTSGNGLETAGKAAGFLIDPSLVGIGVMTAPTVEEFEDQGGGRRGLASAVLTLVVKNPKGLGRFT